MAGNPADSGAAGATFVEDLRRRLPPEARPALDGVLREWRGVTLYLPANKTEERRRAAAALLSQRFKRHEVQESLRQRFKISKATAYRDINSSLLSQNSNGLRRDVMHDRSIDQSKDVNT